MAAAGGEEAPRNGPSKRAVVRRALTRSRPSDEDVGRASRASVEVFTSAPPRGGERVAGSARGKGGMGFAHGPAGRCWGPPRRRAEDRAVQFERFFDEVLAHASYLVGDEGGGLA